MNDPKDHWVGMPSFNQQKKTSYATIILRVDNQQDLDELSARLGQKLTPKTKSAWFPFKSHWGAEKKIWITKHES